jgi:hypothetical protein
MTRIDHIDVWTCEGREHRPVYRIGDLPLAIENEQGKLIVQTRDFHVIAKPANACGGIADLPEPQPSLAPRSCTSFGPLSSIREPGPSG